MNWKAAGAALGGAVVGGTIGFGVGHYLAPRLRLQEKNGDHHRYAASSLLAGAGLGAIVGLALASESK